MYNPTRNLTTRAALAATAAHNVRWFASLLAGSAMLGSTAHAVNNFWESDSPAGSSDWDVPGNWSLGRIPANPNGEPTGDTFDDAFINIVSPGYPIVTNNTDFNPRDVKVGVGEATNGRLDVRQGVITNTGWTVIGDNGGTGELNVANTGDTGGPFTGFGTGTGGLQIGFRLYVGGEGTGAAGGTANINTSGTIALGEHLVVGNGNGPGGTLNLDAGTVNVNGESWIGQGAGGVGKMNISGGTLNSNSWAAIGREGGNGEVVMTGGAWNKTGGGEFIVGDNSVGVLSQPADSTGSITINNQMWVGQGGSGDGTYNLDSGSISMGSWVAIGREGGTGTVNMTGGNIVKTGGGSQFIVGASGPGSMTQSGGLVDIQGGYTWVGEASGATTATLTLEGTAEFRTPIMSVGPESPNAVLNLDGGTLQTRKFVGTRNENDGASSGNGTIHFNGTQIIATADAPDFIASVDTLDVAAGGLLLDTNGFNLGVAPALPGTGGVVKSGAGTLTLSGANSYSGATSVNEGTLNVSTDATGGGAITVAGGAALGVNQPVDTGVLGVSGLTLGESDLSVSAAFGAGNPAAAPVNVTGTLAVNGEVAIHLADEQPVAGLFPVISYGSKSGAGSFVPGTMPDGVVLNGTTPVVDSGSVISLNIERASSLRWTGDVSDTWNTSTANWVNSFTGDPALFVNGDPVLFEDLINFQNFNVTLGSTVSPGGSGVTVDNDISDYTISGGGVISGTSGLTKRGFARLILGNMANDFTGPAVLEEGAVEVPALADAGSPSPLGAGDLVLAGGVLDYTGGAVSITRGFEIDAASNALTSELILAADVTMSGPVTATSGKLRLSGPGVLALTHAGPISLANGPQDGNPATLLIDGGGLTLNGSGQTADIIGNTQIGVADGADTAFTVGGDTVVTLRRFQVGFGVGSTPSVLIEGSAAVNKIGGSWLSIANSNDSQATMTVRDSGSFTSDGGDFNVGDTATSNGTLILEDQALVSSVGPVFIGKNGTTGAVDLSGDSTMISGDTNVAGGGGSNGDLTLRGTSSYTSNGRLQVGPGGGSTGEVVIEDDAEMTVNSYVSVGFNGGGSMIVRENGSFTNTDDFSVNENGDVPATVTVQDNASMSVARTVFVGRNTDRVGTLTVSGAATLEQTDPAFSFIVGPAGTGTLDISGTASVTMAATSGLMLTNTATGTATVNLGGGSLVTGRVSDAGGSSTFNFDGGLLTAGTGANPDYMNGLDNAFVEDGGAAIDSNGQDIAVGQALLAGTTAGGGLTKSGAGTLFLNGANTYTGTTTVTAGALGGTGSIPGALVVESGAALAPGAATGTFTAGGNATFQAGSAFVVNIDDSQAADNGRLDVTGILNVTGAALQVNVTGTAASAPYTIATGGTVTGPFASVPDGVSVTYGTNSITITPPALTPFQSWMANFPSLTGEDAEAGADPDGDGLTNVEEFGLDGDPTSGTATGKVRSRIETVGPDQALVITFPVRAAATFDNVPGPGADATVAADGIAYLVGGSNDLAAFDQGVTEIPASTDGMPALSSAAWTYKSFRLAGAIPARGAKGFLTVTVEETP